jgi:hypothetical protein
VRFFFLMEKGHGYPFISHRLLHLLLFPSPALQQRSKAPIKKLQQLDRAQQTRTAAACNRWSKSGLLEKIKFFLEQVISAAVKGPQSAASRGGEACAAGEAARKPKPPIIGRKSKSSAFLSGLVKQKRPQKGPPAGAAPLLSTCTRPLLRSRLSIVDSLLLLIEILKNQNFQYLKIFSNMLK